MAFTKPIPVKFSAYGSRPNQWMKKFEEEYNFMLRKQGIGAQAASVWDAAMFMIDNQIEEWRSLHGWTLVYKLRKNKSDGTRGGGYFESKTPAKRVLRTPETLMGALVFWASSQPAV